VPSDVAAGSAGRGDGDVGLDGDLVGVRSDGDLDGLTGMGQANLDLLAADHDRPADRDPPGDDQGFGQLGQGGCPDALISVKGWLVQARVSSAVAD